MKHQINFETIPRQYVVACLFADNTVLFAKSEEENSDNDGLIL